jgi:hypothetical protein
MNFTYGSYYGNSQVQANIGGGPTCVVAQTLPAGGIQRNLILAIIHSLA